MKRRNLIKGLALLPLAGGAISGESVSAASPDSNLSSATLTETGKYYYGIFIYGGNEYFSLDRC
jgi:hypothetical protein